MINNEIIESYLNCKYKAHQKLNNEQGVKTEFELLQDEKLSECKTKFYDCLLEEHGKNKLLEGFKFGDNGRISKVNVVKEHGLKNPIMVAEQDRKIVGWGALSKWSDRCAYSDTAEISVYVEKKHQKKGIGRKLLEKTIKEGEKAGIHTVIAWITEGNDASIHLHKSRGFFHIGVMKEVGFKFDKRLDVYLMQKIYSTK